MMGLSKSPGWGQMGAARPGGHMVHSQVGLTPRPFELHITTLKSDLQLMTSQAVQLTS
jgi:hypothetical protein